MFIYRNTSDQPLVIPNVGLVMPRKTIESETELTNENLELVEHAKKDTKKAT